MNWKRQYVRQYIKVKEIDNYYALTSYYEVNVDGTV